MNRHPMSTNPRTSPRTFVLGITGASGAAYALRLLDRLLAGGHTVHLVVSDYGKRLLADEADITQISLGALGAVIASGSFLHHGMVVLPCSSTSLGAIASGSGSNLLTRAAMVTIKERRPLIVCHRETPLNLIDIENMRTLTLAGAIICPTNPGLYLRPTSVADIIDFIAGKVLDLLDVEHNLDTRWKQNN